MAESDYHPSGWLALLLGKALYISMTSQEEADKNLGMLLTRLLSSSSDSQSEGNGSRPFEVLTTRVRDLETELASTKMKLDQVLAKNEEMEKKLDAVLEKLSLQ